MEAKGSESASLKPGWKGTLPEEVCELEKLQALNPPNRERGCATSGGAVRESG
jgi:hypothetical protein